MHGENIIINVIIYEIGYYKIIMKYGYSILLGEHVEASAIEYDDCKSFQIVCPICKEPIFKVVRTQGFSDNLHYLSHYEKSKSFIEDCELRVNSLKKEIIESSSYTSRNQRLKYFLKILRDTVLKNEYGGDHRKILEKLKQMQYSKTLQFIRDRFYEIVSSSENLIEKNHVFLLFDEYIKDITEISGGFPKTDFSIITQKRIAFDMWIHLLSPNAHDNFEFMFNNSYLFLMFRIDMAKNVRPLFDFESQMYSNMHNLIVKPKTEGMAIIESMLKYPLGPPHAIDSFDLLSKMLSEIQHEIYGCLLRLPYFRLLKDGYN